MGQEGHKVQCPWCFELVELTLSPDDAGEMIEDCQVCCRPWQLTVLRPQSQGDAWADDEDGGHPPTISVERA